jgi:hypothetical protein
MIRTGGEPGLSRELEGSLIHSYPAEQGVPNQDASCEANRLREVGPIFGDGSKPRRAPATHLPHSSDAPSTGQRTNLVSQIAFRRAPSGTRPVAR